MTPAFVCKRITQAGEQAQISVNTRLRANTRGAVWHCTTQSCTARMRWFMVAMIQKCARRAK